MLDASLSLILLNYIMVVPDALFFLCMFTHVEGDGDDDN